MDHAVGKPGKVLVVDAQPDRARRAVRALAREGYQALLFRDPDIAFAYAFRSGPDLEAAVVPTGDGSERGLIEGLRILRPDLQIFASSEPTWNALEE
jgi:hypothetical protein